MQLIVTIAREVAEDLRDQGATPAASRINEVISQAGGQLFPQEYATKQFVIEIDDEQRGAQLLGQLSRCDGIEAGYPQPLVEGA